MNGMDSKVEEILDEFDEVIDKAKSVPFVSNRYLVDVERLRELVNDVRLNLPNELKEARMIAFDRERILNEAKAKAESIVSKAEKRADALAAESEIAKEARKKAIDILQKAQNNSKEIKRAADEYVDNLMNNTERFMTAALQSVKKKKSDIRESRR